MADDEELLVETYHDRLRDAVLRQLSETEIRGHSAALAEALERRGARDPEWLADLWSHAAQRQKAGEYSYLAADRAEQTLAFTNAARLYRQALDSAPRSGAAEAEARQRLANALSHAGRSRESAEEYLRAAALCDVSAATELRCRAALRYLTSGHLDDGMTTLRGVLRETGLRYPSGRLGAIAALLYQRAALLSRPVGCRGGQSEIRSADATSPGRDMVGSGRTEPHRAATGGHVRVALPAAGLGCRCAARSDARAQRADRPLGDQWRAESPLCSTALEGLACRRCALYRRGIRFTGNAAGQRGPTKRPAPLRDGNPRSGEGRSGTPAGQLVGGTAVLRSCGSLPARSSLP